MYKYTFAFLLLTSPVAAQAPSVLTDIPAVHSLVSQVMQGVASPQILLDQGSDPHSFQMRPSQARALSEADMLFFIGPELTPWLERAIDGVGIKGEVIELLEAKGTVLREFEEHGDHDEHEKHDEHTDHEKHDEHADHDNHEEKHDDDAHANEGEEHGHEEHGHGEHGHGEHGHGEHHHDGIDPHAWLTPLNAIVWLDKIASELAVIDAQNADAYLANASAAKVRIAQLDTEIAALLAPMKDTPIIVFHDAYGYFADQYDLNIAGTIREGDAATPGAAHLSELRQMISQSGVACAFGEEQHDPALVQTLFADANVSMGVLDPSGTSLEYGPELYDALLRKIAQEIAGCVAN